MKWADACLSEQAPGNFIVTEDCDGQSPLNDARL